MKIFVYGTLKKGGVLHSNLDGCTYHGIDRVPNFTMFKVGWFPAIKPTEDARECVYGEVYEINKSTLSKLDEIEGKGVLYERSTVNTRFGKCIIYVFSDNNDTVQLWDYPKIPYGFFPIENKYWEVKIGDDYYDGDASRIVFDLRFFDTSAGRCSTNSQYMKLYSERANDNYINTKNEDVFLSDLIIDYNIEEL